ncbi:MAG: hypothetical protein LC658_07105, partial [Bacteroidales bacterium]|nr:hypothetical protein [Bacteroidales bacterium]
LKVVIMGQNGVAIDDILIHDATEADPTLHMALINMKLPDMPVAFGVIRSVAAPVYDTEMVAQIEQIQQTRKIKNVDELLNSGNTWEVTGNTGTNGSGCPKNNQK